MHGDDVVDRVGAAECQGVDVVELAVVERAELSAALCADGLLDHDLQLVERSEGAALHELNANVSAVA